ncbi:MAG: tripartite tricarboxylate transporter TctB family protein [Pseudomonadota bacterium]
MGKLTSQHITETVVWLAMAVVLFALSFDFNQTGEIYPPGPSSWPRVVIALLVLAALGNAYYHWRNGDALQSDRIGVSHDEETLSAKRSLGATVRIGLILTVPFLFAIALKPIGFYSAAPFFIVAVIVLMGERRPLHILAITILIYILLILFFLVLLNANLPQGRISPFYDYSNQILIWNTQFQNWLGG